jgi:hypothetical protein
MLDREIDIAKSRDDFDYYTCRLFRVWKAGREFLVFMYLCVLPSIVVEATRIHFVA